MKSAETLAKSPKGYREVLLGQRLDLLAKRAVKLSALTAMGRVAYEDQATLLHEEFVSITVDSLVHDKLKAIDAALSRLDRGDYGICVECGDRVSARRLAALPWASLCIACQEWTSFASEPIELCGLAA